jgi:hypothetical protein
MDWRIYFWVVWVVESLGIPKLYPTATLPYSSHLGLGVLDIFMDPSCICHPSTVNKQSTVRHGRH